MSDEVPFWTLLAVVLLAVAALYVRGLAGRLDRLHLRVEAARDALDAQLLRRAGAVLDLVSGGGLDVASAFLLLEAATDAQDAVGGQREVAESALSADLRAVLDEPDAVAGVQELPGGGERLAAVASAAERVVLARRFHNDAVRAARELRQRGLVRMLHLAGRAALPQSFEMDDAPPEALSAISRNAT